MHIGSAPYSEATGLPLPPAWSPLLDGQLHGFATGKDHKGTAVEEMHRYSALHGRVQAGVVPCSVASSFDLPPTGTCVPPSMLVSRPYLLAGRFFLPPAGTCIPASMLASRPALAAMSFDVPSFLSFFFFFFLPVFSASPSGSPSAALSESLSQPRDLRWAAAP
eukprot:CAMPEP_0179299398 /NCGR_PEP_ID=MMETSP0797-20121207/46496_1 /TAXON_ID=47934 /ORGANISM="Dinophysis acuminata, Strain DAEP01" /LENGTH=163 /DNA_ID=CAMNT_0021008831 /DNA_START=28 /DNA_END=515 /DNA_ORIENTATION=+